MGQKLVERARREGVLTMAGDFVANHVLRAEALLVQAGLGAAQFRKSGSGSVAVVVRFVPIADIGRLRAVRQQRGYARQNNPDLGELARLRIDLD